MKHFSGLRAEWRNIRRGKILLLSLIVIMFIPIMYGGFFLGSVWNPYGNTNDLPVAVVNDDQGAELNGAHINIGNDLVASLKKNQNMGWRFVSADSAEKGLYSGKYYMRLVIPADFSRDVATITTVSPAASTLYYTTTPARNYIASLLTTQAAEQIQQTVATNVRDAYLSALFKNIATLKDGLKQASAGAATLASGSDQLSGGVKSYTDGASRLAAGQDTLVSGLTSLYNGAATLRDGLGHLNTALPTNDQIAQLTNGVKSLETSLDSLNDLMQHPNGELVAQQNKVSSAAGALGEALSQYESSAEAASGDIANLQASLSSGATTTNVNTAAMLNLIISSQDVATKTTGLLGELASLTSLLSAQQASLASGVSALNSGMTALAPGLSTALNGYTSLRSGASTLASGSQELASGSRSALDGGQQVLSGLRTLNNSSSALTAASSSLASGSDELSRALQKASAELSLQPTNTSTKDQIAQPVKATKTTRGEVPNYGFALSPYVLSLGLFVGALVFNVIYPVRRFASRQKGALNRWATKMSVAAIVAIGQALVLDAIMVFCLGLKPDNLGAFVLTTLITSIMYMSVVSLLSIALDNVGRFIAMALLVLQLGAAGGVFPIMLSNGFFQAVNPFVPMTYSIYAYRQAISSGVGGGVYWSSLALLVTIAIVANILLIVFLKMHGTREFDHESVDAD